jgi:hypothetical protein
MLDKHTIQPKLVVELAIPWELVQDILVGEYV